MGIFHEPAPQPPGDYYDRRWGTNLIAWLDQWMESFKGDVELPSKLITRGGRCEKTTLVTDATYTILLTDQVVDVNRAGTVALTLPENPTNGATFEIQDSSGAASSNTITINESASIQVNGTTSVTLTTDYGRLTIKYNGTMYVAA